MTEPPDTPDVVDGPPFGEGDDEWLTTEQVSELFGCHRETVRRWVRSGRITSRRAGRRGRVIWVLRRDVEQLIEQGTRSRPPDARSGDATIVVPGERVTLATE